MPTHSNRLATTLQNTGYRLVNPLSQTKRIISIITEPHTYQGYILGFRQPTCFVQLKAHRFNTTQSQHLRQALQHYFNLNYHEIHDAQALIQAYTASIHTIQRQGQHPIFDHAKVHRVNQQQFQAWIPCLFWNNLFEALDFMIKLFNHHLSDTTFAPNQDIQQQLNNLIKTLRQHGPQTQTMFKFIEAAHHDHIPWSHVSHNVFQFGYSRHSEWLDASFTDETSFISTMLVKNKYTTALLLRQKGLPVPEHQLVESEKEAISAASAIGYPVAIKPNNQDAGHAVYPHLQTDESVKTAYQRLAKQNYSVLLEKNITGRDYRLLVHHGKLIWAIERKPASITGDGKHTIRRLIEMHNDKKETIWPIKPTDDVASYLAEQHLAFSSIIGTGKTVQLNRIANISSGGTPIAVFDKIHPDNQRLAEAAAQLLRLDIAGIDFISPDIEASYLDNGGTILEVNAQPQLGSITSAHLYKQILNERVPKNGRIPIIVVYGEAHSDTLLQHLMANLTEKQSQIGIVKRDCAYRNDTLIAKTDSAFRAALSLLTLKDIDALIYCVEAKDIEQFGLPFSRYHQLILSTKHFNTFNQNNNLVDSTLEQACEYGIFKVEDILSDY